MDELSIINKKFYAILVIIPFNRILIKMFIMIMLVEITIMMIMLFEITIIMIMLVDIAIIMIMLVETCWEARQRPNSFHWKR